MDTYDGHDYRNKDTVSSSVQAASKPWLMIWFRCCDTYGRIYRNQAGTRYSGCCPMCRSAVDARIGQGGTDSRMFEAQ